MRARVRDGGEFGPGESRHRRWTHRARLFAFAAVLELVRHPLRSSLVLLLLGSEGAILINALGLQPGRHPAPFFSERHHVTGAVALPVPLPPPRPRTPLEQQTAVPAPLPAPPGAADPTLVRAVQLELGARGFYDGRADGSPGSLTEKAIKAFERMSGLPVTGRPSPELLARLRKSELWAADSAPDRRGGPGLQDESDERRVLEVQRLLADLGYGPGPIDGQLGAETRRAIERFELDRGLPATGLIHDRLLRELSSVIGSPSG